MNSFFNWFGLPGVFVLTCLMSLYAAVLAALHPSGTRLLLVAAMLLSSLGDIILMDFRHISRHIPVNCFYAGAGAFMASHLVYALTFLLRNKERGGKFLSWGLLIGVCLSAAVIGFMLIQMNRGQAKPSAALVAVCLIYMLVIGFHLCCTSTYAWHTGGVHILTAVGIFIFAVSDVFIGLDKLCGISTYHKLVWWVYPIGQILILTFA